MINRTTYDRINALVAEYREVADQYPDALSQIAMAELAETVQQSNAIENSTLTLDDTERILDGRIPRGAHELREVYEAKNLAAVTSEILIGEQPLSMESVLQWHGVLLAGIRDDAAGRFRRAGEWVRVGGHVGANPEFVPTLVADALRRYREEAPADPIDAIARFHCEFEIIHPFVDGNGRIGRVIIAKQLADLDLPPVIVRARNRHRDYYPLLEQYSRTNSHGGMTRLLALLLLESLHKRISLVTRPRVIPLSEWARRSGMGGASAANKARRQTIPAFRLRDRWMISEDFR